MAVVDQEGEFAELGPRGRWRLCTLAGERPMPALIRAISARGAELQTDEPLPLGAAVELRHPQAGAVSGVVTAHLSGVIGVAFHLDVRSVAFALAMLAMPSRRPVQSSTHSLRG